MMDDTIQLEIVFATPQRQCLLPVATPSGRNVRQLVLESPLVANFPDVDFATCPIGIWGRLVPDDHLPVTGDRVEVYRPLVEDPREARRKLALRGQSMGQADSRDPTDRD